jgi:hypothetical protein
VAVVAVVKVVEQPAMVAVEVLHDLVQLQKKK